MPITIDQTVSVPTAFGVADVLSFRGVEAGNEPVVFAFGDWKNVKIPRVRIHSECLTGDVFGSMRCDCGPQLHEALKTFGEGGGILIYLRQEGRGIGLYNKLKAYKLQDEGVDTYEANRRLGFPHDLRNFEIAGEMLKAMGVNEVYLLSNNPVKAEHLERAGVAVKDRIFTQTYRSPHNEQYLRAKSEIGGHDGLKKND